MPYGGIYLVGGVMEGIKQYLMENREIFIQNFTNKGRLSQIVKDVPVYIAGDIDVGLRGAQECAIRLI